jgi:hypothetical protein
VPKITAIQCSAVFMPIKWRGYWSYFESCTEAGSSSCKNIHTHTRFLHVEDFGRGSSLLSLRVLCSVPETPSERQPQSTDCTRPLSPISSVPNTVVCGTVWTVSAKKPGSQTGLIMRCGAIPPTARRNWLFLRLGGDTVGDGVVVVGGVIANSEPAAVRF